MPFPKATAKGGDFKPVPAGVYLAICSQIIDLGVQKTTYMKEEKRTRQVYLKFEIPEVRIKYKRDDVEHEGPATIGHTFTNSIGKKSKLRPLLEAWRGKSFTEEEERGFDITTRLGKPCQLAVVHETGQDDRTYANISQIMGLSTAQREAYKANPLKAENPLILYTPEEHDQRLFGLLPEWLRAKIACRVIEQPNAAPNITAGTQDDWDDEIPF